MFKSISTSFFRLICIHTYRACYLLNYFLSFFLLNSFKFHERSYIIFENMSSQLNSWIKYSNELSNYLQNSPMSTRFWSPTFRMTMLNQWGTKPQKMLSHSLFSSHASFICPLFVTSTSYGGNHALFQFSMLIFNVLFANCWFV